MYKADGGIWLIYSGLRRCQESRVQIVPLHQALYTLVVPFFGFEPAGLCTLFMDAR